MPSRSTAAQLHALGQLERQLRAVDPYSGRKYLRDFSEAFCKYQGLVTDAEFQARLQDAEIVFIGDYHALPRSQQFAAEVVEFLAGAGRQVVLGLETFFTSDQPILDGWQSSVRGSRSRSLAEIALRVATRFDAEWGYPWEPIYKLLLRANGVDSQIAALDQYPRRDLRSIARRDRHAADAIARLRSARPDAVIVVLFGESHLSPGHLPEQVTKALGYSLRRSSVVTLLQNVDALYWQAVSRDRIRHCRCQGGEMLPAVRVNDDVICVFNASPLEKYESYRACLERWREG